MVLIQFSLIIKKDWTSRTLPTPYVREYLIFVLPPPALPHPLKVDVMCVSPLNKVSWRNTVFQRLQEANLCPKVSFACVLNFLIT